MLLIASVLKKKPTTQTNKQKPKRILRWGGSSVLLRCALYTGLVLVLLLHFGGELHQIGLCSARGQAGAEAPGPFRLEHGLRAGSSHRGQEK